MKEELLVLGSRVGKKFKAEQNLSFAESVCKIDVIT